MENDNKKFKRKRGILYYQYNTMQTLPELLNVDLMTPYWGNLKKEGFKSIEKVIRFTCKERGCSHTHYMRIMRHLDGMFNPSLTVEINMPISVEIYNDKGDCSIEKGCWTPSLEAQAMKMLSDITLSNVNDIVINRDDEGNDEYNQRIVYCATYPYEGETIKAYVTVVDNHPDPDIVYARRPTLVMRMLN